ncbi:MAG: energy transducer TonB [Desulfomonilaceae bacterium]
MAWVPSQQNRIGKTGQKGVDMESFPYVNGSYDPSSDTLHALVATGPVSRLLCGFFGLRGRSSLFPEDDLSSESGPCSIVLGDQDSSIFQTYVEPHFEWELEPYDSTVQDLSSSAAFLDWEVPGDSEPADLQKCTPDIVLVGDDFEGGFSQSSSPSGLLNEKLRSFAAGFVIHFVGFCLFFSIPTPLPKGLGGISDKPMFVRLTETDEINTPDDPSPASINSPASLASLARRNPKPEENNRKKSEKEEPTEVAAKQAPSEPQTDSRHIEVKSADRPDLPHQKVLPDHSLEHGPFNDSKNSQDSLASTPSVATPERKGSFKAGDEALTYKDRILSAIHEAAYYPRAGLRHRAHGKTLVRFTINKDGSLANVAIVSHADSKVLDEAALKIVEKASSHFPLVPDSLMKEQVSYVVPIVFKKGL